MNHVDLCSGIGGFALAARWSGFETIQFCEIDKFCQSVLKKHWPNIPIHDDLKTFQYDGKIDLLTAGFPCQPFSTAGKRKGDKDDRYLWPDVLRVIKQSKPEWILLENVPGIINWLDPILEDLENQGYTWWAYLVAASSIGAPHKRERLWIVAHSNSQRCDERGDHWKKRSIQANWEQYMEEIQSKWPQFISQSWKIMQANEWLSANAGFSRIHDGLPNRVDRIKGVGNAVCPQIPYIFMLLIKYVSEKVEIM